MPGHHPPRPRLTLNIGITGHRSKLLSPGVVTALGPCLSRLFGDLADAALRLHREEAAIFDGASPELRLHTPLATGSDQLAATSAHDRGFYVRALLPFAPDVYCKDFAEGDERDEFVKQLNAAYESFALPGLRSDQDEAYVMVGKAVIAAADILIAIWDGGEGNGPGGTAHVVDLALRGGVPVIHVTVDREADDVGVIRLLVGGDSFEPIAQPLAGAEGYAALIRDTLAPHTQIEREQIADYLTEREKRTNWRIEYPLLLALLRVKALPWGTWRQSSIDEDNARERQSLRNAFAPSDRLRIEHAYGWANFLAIRYAQLFRSGHATNYGLSALAVIIALGGLVAPAAKVYLVLAELGAISLLFFNTHAGNKGDWHRRWLQYRHLAESLRPLIYLKQTGMATPPFRTDFIGGPRHRDAGADWTRWYAAAIWREMASPKGIMTPARIRELADDVVAEQIEPQAAYHQINAKRMRLLDHRLHGIGNLLMGAVITACFLFLVLYALVPESVRAMTSYFIFATAGLPAVGASVFGMRGHGEHLLAASRSLQTVSALNGNAERLNKVTQLDALSAELDNTAEIMLADLNEWFVAYRERSLEVPA